MKKILMASLLIIATTNAYSDPILVDPQDLQWKNQLFSSNFDSSNRESRKEVAKGILSKIVYIQKILNKWVNKKNQDDAIKKLLELLREIKSGNKDAVPEYNKLLNSPEMRIERINSYLNRVQSLLEIIIDDGKIHAASDEIIYWAKLNDYLSGPGGIGGDIVDFCKDHPISDEEKKNAFFVPPFEPEDPWGFYMTIGWKIQSKIVIPMLEEESKRKKESEASN